MEQVSGSSRRIACGAEFEGGVEPEEWDGGFGGSVDHAGEDGGEVGEVGGAAAVFGEEAVDGFIQHVLVRGNVVVVMVEVHFRRINGRGMTGDSDGDGDGK